MELRDKVDGGVTIVEPGGRIDLAGAPLFEERLVALIRSGARRILLDFRNVQYISSPGFRALLIARRLVDESGGNLVLCGLSPEVKRVFVIGKFTDMFSICTTADEALARLR